MKQQAPIKIRDYHPADARALSDIFYHTIHHINSRDYSPAQINAWAPSSSLELTGWQKKWHMLKPIVAEINGEIVGFAEFESNGHIDCFYCHHAWIGKQVGSALMAAIDAKAKEQHNHRIFAEVSITAKAFFESKGFVVVQQQTIIKQGVELTNFVMEKWLS